MSICATLPPYCDVPPHGRERREALRQLCPLAVVCRARDHSSWWQANVLDLSRTGIVLVVARRVAPGMILDIEFQHAAGCALGKRSVRVAHARQDEDGYWLARCVFEPRLQQEEFASLLRRSSVARLPCA